MTALKMPVPYKIGEKLELFKNKEIEKILDFKGNALIEAMFYLYFFKKYKTNCFLFANDRGQLGLSIEIQIKYESLEKKRVETHIDIMAKKLSDCIKRKNTKTIIIPLQLRFAYGNHANILIFRKKFNQIEHFEHHGQYFSGNINIDANYNIIKKWLTMFVSKLNTYLNEEKKINSIDSSQVCPFFDGLQSLEGLSDPVTIINRIKIIQDYQNFGQLLSV